MDELGWRLEIIETGEPDLPGALAQAAEQPFDLATQVPVRARLLRAAADVHVLVVVIHHIATDGWSMVTLRREVRASFRAGCFAAFELACLATPRRAACRKTALILDCQPGPPAHGDSCRGPTYAMTNRNMTITAPA